MCRLLLFPIQTKQAFADFTLISSFRKSLILVLIDITKQVDVLINELLEFSGL